MKFTSEYIVARHPPFFFKVTKCVVYFLSFMQQCDMFHKASVQIYNKLTYPS